MDQGKEKRQADKRKRIESPSKAGFDVKAVETSGLKDWPRYKEFLNAHACVT